MPWEAIVRLEALSSQEMRQIDRADRQYLLCRMGEELFLLDNECPHAGGPLAMGNFSPPLVICPWHAWEFDCRTGECVHSSKASIRRYPVELRDGVVYGDFPDEAQRGCLSCPT